MRQQLAWWVNVTVAGLIAAAAFLAFSEPLGWPESVSRTQYLPVAVHLILNALLLMATRRYSEWLNSKTINIKRTGLYILNGIGLLTWSGVNAILAIQALITLQASKLPVVLLAVPAAVGLWAVFDFLERRATDPGEIESDRPDDDDAAEEPIAVPIVTPQSGINEPLGVLKRMAFMGLYPGMITAVMMYGYMYWHLLSSILIDSKVISLGRMWQVLSNPILLIFPLVIITTFSLIGVVGALGWQVAYWHTKPSRHLLSEQEQTYVREAYLFIKKYLQNRKYPILYLFLYYGSFIFLFAIFFVMIFISQYYMDTVIRSFEAPRTEGLDWYLYIDQAGGSVFVGIFAICSAYISAAVIIMRRLPRLSEYVAKQLFFHSEHSQDHEDRRLVAHIVYSVRTVNLDTDRGFRAEDLPRLNLHFDFTLLHIITVLLILSTAWLWHHDRGDYDLFTEDYIEYVDYWTLEKFRMPYGKVQNVEVGCTVDKDGDPSVTYIVRLNERHFVNLFSMDQFDIKRYPERLADYEKLNRKLRHAGVPFVPADEEQADAADCMRALRKDYGADLAPRLMRLLYELHPS